MKSCFSFNLLNEWLVALVESCFNLVHAFAFELNPSLGTKGKRFAGPLQAASPARVRYPIISIGQSMGG